MRYIKNVVSVVSITLFFQAELAKLELNNYKKQRLRYLFFTDYFVTLYPALRI